MAPGKVRVRQHAEFWALVRRQHGVVTRRQLLGFGYGDEAIRHRLRVGRLHRLGPGVYAVGRPDVSERGGWMAAVLACGPQALLSHRNAAELWRICRPGSYRGSAEVVVPQHLPKRRSGIRTHRRGPAVACRLRIEPEANPGPLDWRLIDGIPVTAPVVTLVDLASLLPVGQLEAAVSEADHLDLIDPDALRAALVDLERRRGTRRLRVLLDVPRLALTTTRLERYFLPLALAAGLPVPETQAQLGTNRVDFFWPRLKLIVETDSLRYHRTAFKQSADRRRDNTHARSGLMTLRFTHGQVRYEPDYVRAELRLAHSRLRNESEQKPGPGTR